MPIYEYRCSACGRKTSIWMRTMKEPEAVACAACGGHDLKRAVSSFAHHKTMKGVWEESGPPSAAHSEDYYKDPRNIGRWTEQRLDQLGVELPGEAREMIDAAREGTLPDSVKDV